MTGPEHYREAEERLSHASRDEGGSDCERYDLAAAQVHAGLAQVAAHVMSLPIGGMPDEPGLDQEEFDDWYAAVNGLPAEARHPAEPYIPVALSVRLRELHQNHRGDCGTCADETGEAQRWPCPTFTALDAAERELSPNAYDDDHAEGQLTETEMHELDQAAEFAHDDATDEQDAEGDR